MNIEKGTKILLSKPSGRSNIEISRHKDPILDHILLVDSIGSNKFNNSWIVQKDLQVWINHLKNDGYTEIKIVQDVGSSQKNNKKKT
jgi:hypothetical protein